MMPKISEHVAFISAIVGVCAASFGLWTQIENRAIKKNIDKIEVELKTRADSRAQKDIDTKYDLAVYQEVVRFIESDKSKISDKTSSIRGDATIALVLSSTTNDLKKSLISLISASKNIPSETANKAGNVLDNISTVRPNSEISQLPENSFPPPPNFSKANSILSDFKVVVFYCESHSNDNKNLNRLTADSLISELKNSVELRDLRIKWESKQLLDIVNSSPGYGINFNQIRYNSEDGEASASVALKNYLENSQTAKSQRINFNLVRVRQRTPNYVSVFVCNN